MKADYHLPYFQQLISQPLCPWYLVHCRDKVLHSHGVEAIEAVVEAIVEAEEVIIQSET